MHEPARTGNLAGPSRTVHTETAPAPTTAAAATSPDQKPGATDAPFLASASPFDNVGPSPFQSNPFRPNPSPAAPFRTSPFAGPGSNPFSALEGQGTGTRVNPLVGRRPSTHGARHVRRHTFIAPAAGPRSPGAYCLPVEEIEYLYEISPGNFRWHVGDTCDFDALAECDTECYCCTEEHSTPHAHPLQAARLSLGECPLTLVDLELYDTDPDVAAKEWEALASLIRSTRDAVLANPALLFTERDARAPIAREILSVAGRPCPPGDDPVEVVIAGVQSDTSVRAATADLGAVYFSSRISRFTALTDTIARLERADLRIRHPDEMQFMMFTLSGASAGRSTVDLVGEHWVNRVNYKSAIDLPVAEIGWSTGWRELAMASTACPS